MRSSLLSDARTLAYFVALVFMILASSAIAQSPPELPDNESAVAERVTEVPAEMPPATDENAAEVPDGPPDEGPAKHPESTSATSSPRIDFETALPPNMDESPPPAPLPTVASVSLAEAWTTRVDELEKQIKFGVRPPSDADEAFNELRPVLEGQLLRLRAALSGNPLELPNEKFLELEKLYFGTKPLYHARMRLLAVGTSNLRNSVKGTDIRGVEERRLEEEAVAIHLRYQLYAVPVGLRRMASDLKVAPLPALWDFFTLALTVLTFLVWRRWARTRLPAAREALLSVQPQERGHKIVAETLRYVDRLRAPWEWFALLGVIFSVVELKEVPEPKYLLWIIIRWSLGVWLVVALVNTIAGSQQERQRRVARTPRLKSLWLIAAWYLLRVLSIRIVEHYSGEGALSGWVHTVFRLLAVPVIVMLIVWWRSDVFRKLEHEALYSEWARSALKRRTGFRSYIGATSGAVYLIFLWGMKQFYREVSRHEGGRRAVTGLFQLKAAKASEGLSRIGVPISSETAERLSGGSELIEEIATEDLAAILEAAERRSIPLAIIGERGAGKTTLLRRAARVLGKAAVFVACPPGTYDDFDRVLARELGIDGPLTPENLTEQIEKQNLAAVLVDDLHRLAKPVIGGQRDLDRLTQLIGEARIAATWIYGFEDASLNYVRRMRGDKVLVTERHLRSWTDREIGQLLDVRSRAAGLDPDFTGLVLPRRFDEEHEADTPDELNRRGFYRLLQHEADGNPAVAQRLWAESLLVDEDKNIFVRYAPGPSLGELDEENLTTLLVLRSITRTELATPAEIADDIGSDLQEVGGSIHAAWQRGWIEELDGRYRLSWKWFTPITRLLMRRNLLAPYRRGLRTASGD